MTRARSLGEGQDTRQLSLRSWRMGAGWEWEVKKTLKNVEPVAVQSSSAELTTSSDTIKATSSPTNFKPFRVPTRVGTTLPQFTAARVVAPGQPMFDCNSPGAIVMPNPPPGHPLRREAGMVQVVVD